MPVLESKRATDLQKLLDLSVISLRWLVLLGLVMSLASGKALSPEVGLVLLIAALWNISLTGLALLGRRLRQHALFCVTVDLVLAALLFAMSDGVGGRLEWAGLLPILSSAIYFGVGEVLLVTAVTLLIQWGIVLQNQPLSSALVFVGTLLPLYLAAGLVLCYVAQKVKLKNSRKERLERQKVQEIQQVEDERRRAIYDLISALSASLNFQRVLEIALDLSTSHLDPLNGQSTGLVCAALVYAPKDTGGTELRITASRHFSAADQRTALPGEGGLIGQAINEREPRLSRNILKDPELSRIFALHTCQSAYCLPLRTGVDASGVLLFAHPDPEFFTTDRREFLDVLSNQANIALQNARLYQDLEREKERIMEIQEDSRKKLARDLHDGPTQSVAALAMRVNFARRLLERDPKTVSDELYKIEELARRTTKEIRHMLFTLRPLVLESQGLVPALESMAEKMQDTYHQNVLVEASTELASQLDLGKQGVIFYIIEEAVNNARKHASATHIWVRLKLVDEELMRVEIQDNGSGFSTEVVDTGYQERGSLGMLNMRERTELLNGVLQVESAEGKGTCVSLLVPLTEEAADRLRRGV